ncbi:hypothetical protein HMPREF1624_02669 [Sporothrix schenckii ATCC 58251]|uniref:Uncharacterized protein n=1 Tax=Sporothrix schenckii (strain ATCC 58251 / de Perez 2211183) TaxID=1391915 RepID=U7Q0R8_SPOS1|nr:hypothetical protein HMPREF1624_02669 [Sporothrix schenckii ATCC 58251]
MPTPASRDENDSVNFNSSCPDDQAPRAQSGWLHPTQSPYEETSHSHHEIAIASGSGSSHSQPPTAVDGEQSPLPAPSPPTMSPVPPLSTDRPAVPETESIYLNASEGHDSPTDPVDPADKPSDTDEEMPDMHTPGTTSNSDSHDDQGDTSDSHSRHNMIPRPSRLSDVHIRSHEIARYSIPEMEVWEPYGTNDALRRQAEAARFGDNRRAAGRNDELFPVGMDGEKAEDEDIEVEAAWSDFASPYAGCDPTYPRLIPAAPSKFLRPGSRFVGTQQSERQVYDVQVEIKHVDLRESFLCGYLRIQGLTEDHPTLTTYFEGEIIGSKYGFNTKPKSWGANDRIDMSHWAKFAAFRPYAKQAKKGNFTIKEHLQKENIFMRWKEHFLVPDHRVRTIHGASFEGFYYICFNQLEGVVHGIYFHSKSEKFQQLELKHVEDKGCMSAVEFR